ncbi:mRNA splicing protein, partial [Coemansia biformis]
MSSITQFLPEPKHVARSRQLPRGSDASPADSTAVVAQGSDARSIPPYGKRRGWVPKALEDFGDGGAYPEVHMRQFPLGMGRSGGKKGNALAKYVDDEGNTTHDALARHGRRENETVQSQFKDMIPLRQRRDFDDSQDAIPERPDADAVREAAERTRQALEKKLEGRAKPVAARGARGGAHKEPTYVRYTPNQQGAEYNSGAAQRIVRVSDMPIDPMEPPKIRLQRQAQAPPSPPAPVMHSPPRKLTADEQKEWTVPPCVSNWKNIHGFTVSLDKRLAADGRGTEELAVSDNFARLSEALISAESHARKEIAERAKIQQTLAQREKEAKEERLRQLAQKAREERAAIPRGAADIPRGAADIPRGAAEPTGSYNPPPMDESPAAAAAAAVAAPATLTGRPDDRTPAEARAPRHGRMAAADFFSDERDGRSRRRSQSPEGDDVRRRDEQRRERRKQHERDLRHSRMGSRPQRTAESRDISEKIALGIARPTATRESMFDSRLFNQPSASNAALQNDEAYNLYDKPLFGAAASSSSNYRPRGIADEEAQADEVGRMMDSDRFGSQLRGPGTADKKDGGGKQPRTGPVEFEKGDV